MEGLKRMISVGWAVLLTLNPGVVLRGEEAPSKIIAEWVSPQGHYVARVQGEGSSDLSYKVYIFPKGEDSNEAEKRAIHSSAQTSEELSFRGIWSASEEVFCLYHVTKSQEAYYQPGGMLFLTKPVKSSDGKVTSLQFENPRGVYLQGEGMAVAEWTSKFHSKLESTMFSNGGVRSCKWEGNDRIEVLQESNFILTEKEGNKTINYRAQWKMVYQLTPDAFKPLEMGAIELSTVDSQTKQATPVKLPPPTLTDELRWAAYLNRDDKVRELLVKGASVTDDSNAPTPLEFAAEKGNLESVVLLLKAGARPGYREVLKALIQKNDTVWTALLDAKPKFAEDDVYSVFQLLFAGARALQLTEVQWNARVDFLLGHLKELGWSMNAVNARTGDTVLIFVLKQPLMLPYLDKVLKAGADPQLKNKAGENAADIAARMFMIPALRQLDTQHKYDALLKEYEILPTSPYIGKWSNPGNMVAMVLNSDGSGFFSTLFAGYVTWKMTGMNIDLKIRLIGANREAVLTGVGTLDSYGQELTIQFTGEAGRMMGSGVTKLKREKSD